MESISAGITQIRLDQEQRKKQTTVNTIDRERLLSPTGLFVVVYPDAVGCC